MTHARKDRGLTEELMVRIEPRAEEADELDGVVLDGQVRRSRNSKQRRNDVRHHLLVVTVQVQVSK